MTAPSEYLVSPAQVRRVQRWLADWGDCPFCDRPLAHHEGEYPGWTWVKTPRNHTPKCVVGLIAWGEK